MQTDQRQRHAEFTPSVHSQLSSDDMKLKMTDSYFLSKLVLRVLLNWTYFTSFQSCPWHFVTQCDARALIIMSYLYPRPDLHDNARGVSALAKACSATKA